MDKNKKYESDILAKRKYNNGLSTFQISKELHNKVKEYCKKNNIKIKDFLETTIMNKIIF